jgi:RND family efflux transporter MFP subunit
MRRGIAVITALAALAAAGCGSEQKPAGETKVPVKTAPVLVEEMSLPVHTSGKLASRVESRLAFKTGGIVGRVVVDEGSSARVGEVLVELQMDEIDARVVQAASAYDKAQRDYRRVENLYADSAATLEQLQDVGTALEVARSDLEIAEFNRRHSVIRAPGDGRVLKRFVEPDELVASGSPVILFGSDGPDWIMRVGVTDRDLLRISLGDSAMVTFDAYPGEDFPAVVTEVVESADPMSGAYEVELTIDRGDHRLVSGFVGSVDIFPGKKERLYLIPIEALYEGDARKGYVYVPEGEKALRVEVDIAWVFRDRLAVRSGLEEYGSVITDGTAYLSEDSSIQVVE